MLIPQQCPALAMRYTFGSGACIYLRSVVIQLLVCYDSCKIATQEGDFSVFYLFGKQVVSFEGKNIWERLFIVVEINMRQSQ